MTPSEKPLVATPAPRRAGLPLRLGGLATRLSPHQLHLRRRLLNRHMALLAALGLLSIAIATVLSRFGDEVGSLGKYGYAGIFAFALVCNLPVVTLFPWMLVMVPLGAVYDPLTVALVAAAGATLGESLPYAIGRRIAPRLPNIGLLGRFQGVTGWRRALIVIVLSLSPALSFPGLVAGAMRFPLWATLAVKFVTEVPKVWVFAAGGRWGPGWLHLG